MHESLFSALVAVVATKIAHVARLGVVRRLFQAGVSNPFFLRALE